MPVSFFTRDMWGASTAHKRLGHRVDFARREGIVYHHTVTVDGDDTPNQWSDLGDVAAIMRKLQTIRPELGLDVPYNLVVFMMEGRPAAPVICEGRGLMRTAAHAPGLNTSHIGVAFAGNFTHWHGRTVNLRSAVLAVEAFLAPYKPLGLSLGQVIGHRDVKSTDCPGDDLYSTISAPGVAV